MNHRNDHNSENNDWTIELNGSSYVTLKLFCVPIILLKFKLFDIFTNRWVSIETKLLITQKLRKWIFEFACKQRNEWRSTLIVLLDTRKRNKNRQRQPSIILEKNPHWICQRLLTVMWTRHSYFNTHTNNSTSKLKLYTDEYGINKVECWTSAWTMKTCAIQTTNQENSHFLIIVAIGIRKCDKPTHSITIRNEQTTKLTQEII